MSGQRRTIGLWSVGFGTLTGAVGGSLVTTTVPARELQFVVDFAVAAAALLAVVFARTREQWHDRYPFVHFVVYFLSLLVATVALDGVAAVLVGGTGLLTRAVEVLVVSAGVGVAVWTTCYGGAERLWTASPDRLGVEW